MRYAAFLRGVMPTNAKMADLKRAFDAAGFKSVKTLLGSGNLLFDAPKMPVSELEAKAQTWMRERLGKQFLTIVRPVDELLALVQSDPFKGVRLTPETKRVVTFLRKAPADLELPIEQDNAQILRLEGNNLFSVYAPTPKGPVFMTLIEKAVGKEQTTRTWQTVEKVVGSV